MQLIQGFYERMITDALQSSGKAYFLEKTEGKAYVSPVPMDQKPPVPVAENEDR